MYIPKEILESMLEDIYSNELEVCGNLDLSPYEKSKIELKVVYKVIGSFDKENKRNMCSQPADKKGSTPYLYHTHPYTSYAYPSFEDIWTVIKERQSGVRFTSFIFTIWGAWILQPVYNDRKIDESMLLKIKKYYEKKIVDFHVCQKQNSEGGKSKECDSVISELIIEYIADVEYTFKNRVKVLFKPWTEIVEGLSV